MGYDDDHGRWMSGHMTGSMGWGGWLVMGFGLLLCLAVIAALLLWVVRSTARQPLPVPAAQPPANAVLDDRFARGDIDEEEYLLRRRVLRPGSGGIG